MKKYLSIFAISFQQEFAYRLNFIMWRVRNVMQLLLVFFLWNTIFSDSSIQFFGYDKDKIITYVFGILVLRALVLSARAVDVAADISKGDLNNYLLKPINYFRFWFARDIASKCLNLSFATLEFLILFFILRPNLFFQTNPVLLLSFIISVGFAVLIYFTILFIVNQISFWVPHMGWGAQFLVIVIVVEFLSGALFPIDILPPNIQNFLYLTPFPYLIFVPIQIYLGKIETFLIVKFLIIAGVWSVILLYLMKNMWNRGLKVYEAAGR